MRELYRESRLSIGITIILGLVTLLMAGYFAAQLFLGPIGTKPAPDWVLAVMTFLFLLITINFSRLTVVLTDAEVRVRYGLFGTSRQWNDITACEKDEENRFYGWGIRFGLYKKQWLWIYNVIGGPRVVFLTGKTKPRGLIISTKNPEEIVRISGEKIGS